MTISRSCLRQRLTFESSVHVALIAYRTKTHGGSGDTPDVVRREIRLSSVLQLRRNFRDDAHPGESGIGEVARTGLGVGNQI